MAPPWRSPGCSSASWRSVSAAAAAERLAVPIERVFDENGPRTALEQQVANVQRQVNAQRQTLRSVLQGQDRGWRGYVGPALFTAGLGLQVWSNWLLAN